MGAVTFWDWLYRVGPGWPGERGWVMVGVFVLAGSMLKMAEVHPSLWNVELFKALLTLVIGTGLINMILPFFFTANKSDETRADNTGKAFDALKAQADALPSPPKVEPDVTLQPGETAMAQPAPIDIPNPEFAHFAEEDAPPPPDKG